MNAEMVGRALAFAAVWFLMAIRVERWARREGMRSGYTLGYAAGAKAIAEAVNDAVSNGLTFTAQVVTGPIPLRADSETDSSVPFGRDTDSALWPEDEN